MNWKDYRPRMQGKDMLTLQDYNPDELNCIINLAIELKEERQSGIPHNYLEKKTLAMIFQKASTRTRVSFEVGAFQLGGNALFLSAQELQMGRGEPVKDTARTLSRYVDGIMIRTFEQAEVEELAHYATVPVINGLTDRFHPCQVLADLLTIKEQKGNLQGLKLAYLGDGNNVAHSLLLGCSRAGMHIAVSTPPEYTPEKEIIELARETAGETGAKVEVTEDPHQAAQDADVLYTDVWASMGQEDEQEQRRSKLRQYQLNRQLLDKAAPEAIVMHCLPAYRGEEISEEVMESSASVIFDQAENRLHAQKALMALIM